MWKLTAAVIVVLIVGLVASCAVNIANAKAMACGDRDAVLQALDDAGLRLASRAVGAGGGRMIEVYRTPSGGQWEMVATYAENPNLACFLGAGDIWVEYGYEVEPEGPIS